MKRASTFRKPTPAPRALLALFMVLAAAAVPASAHVCIISPHQRGALNVSAPGNPTCFRHGAPCGGMAPGPVVAALDGSSAEIVFEQAYNHMQVGKPGLMIVRWAASPNARPEEFQELLRIDDYNPRYQATARNYTLKVDLPQGVSEPSAVLQVLYQPDKTGEDTFYQCADVAIRTNAPGQQQQQRPERQPAQQPAPLPPVAPRWASRSADALGSLVGLELGEAAGTVQLTRLNPSTGAAEGSFVLPNVTAVRGDKAAQPASPAAEGAALLNDMVAFDPDSRVLYYARTAPGGLTALSLLAVPVDAPNEARVLELPASASAPEGFAFTLDYVRGQNALAVAFVAPAGPAEFVHSVYLLALDSLQFKKLASFPPENTFLNFMWSAYDASTRKVHLLMQDENNALDMDSVLLSVSVESGAAATTKTDVTNFTYEELHAGGGAAGGAPFVALSPGLSPARTDNNAVWHAVWVNPETGANANAQPLNAGGDPSFPDLADFYAGQVRNALVPGAGRDTLYHVFNVAGHSRASGMVATITLPSDPATGAPADVSFAPAAVPLSNLWNLVFVPHQQ